MTDTELLREALYLLVLLEQHTDPERDMISVSRQTWLLLTENFRQKMEAERRRRL